MRLYHFVCRLTNSLSIYVRADSMVQAREELARKIRDAMDLDFSMPGEQAWDCVSIDHKYPHEIK